MWTFNNYFFFFERRLYARFYLFFSAVSICKSHVSAIFGWMPLNACCFFLLLINSAPHNIIHTICQTIVLIECLYKCIQTPSYAQWLRDQKFINTSNNAIALALHYTVYSSVNFANAPELPTGDLIRFWAIIARFCLLRLLIVVV